MTDKKFEDILDDCLQRLFGNGETIEECLAAYPQHSDELKPLLITAYAAKQASDTLKPRPEFRARARHQFYAELNDMASVKKSPFLLRRFRLATVLTGVIAMLIVSGSIVAAASSSMPNSLLYPVKLAVEQVQINLTFSDIGKTKLHTQFADRRVEEIIHMAEVGNIDLAQATIERLDDQLAMISDLTVDYNQRSLFGSAESGLMTTVADKQDLTTGGTQEILAPETPTVTATPSWDVSVGSPPPYITLGGVLSTDLDEDDEVALFLNEMFQNGNSNSARLRSLLGEVSDSVKPVLLQAIALLENGYQDAINNIIE
ncbi:DUF5667 domain-containing protein [Chloroflexota bacterium]